MKKFIAALAVMFFATTAYAKEQVVIKIASSYGAVSTFNEQAQFIADRVLTLTNGTVKMEIKPSGALVPSFQVLDATASGAVGGAWTQSYYWVGKDKTLSLFNSPLGGPYGMVLTFLGGCFMAAVLKCTTTSIRIN